MTHIKLVCHPISENLDRTVSDTLLPQLRAGDNIDVLMPSVNHIKGLKETLLRRLDLLRPGQIYFGTFFAWSNRILDTGHQYYRVISSGEEWLLLFKFITKNPRLFGDMKPGSLNLILRVITELRESDLSLKQLNDWADTCPDIAAYVECLNYLVDVASKRRIASSATLLMLLSNYLEYDHFSPTAESLLVAGFYEFNPIQRKILNLLIDRYKNVMFYYPEQLDHPAHEYIKPVQEIMTARKFHQRNISSDQTGELRRLSRQLFTLRPVQKDLKDDHKPAQFSTDWRKTSLKILSCPTRRQEVDAAVRTIKKWIVMGIQPQDIAVVYRGNQDYQKLISLIFPDSGILVNSSRQVLSASSPVRILQKIFEINEQNFSRNSIVDLTRFKEIRDYYGYDVMQKFEYRSAAWGLSFSKDSWQQQLNQRREYLQSVQNATDEEGMKDSFILHRELREIETILPVLQQFLDDISLPFSACWTEYIRLLQMLLKKYCFQDNSIDDIRSAMQDVLNNLQILTDATSTITLPHFSIAINMLMNSVNLPEADSQAETGITVDDLMNVRHRRYKAIVLLGLVDDEFPVSRRENPLMNSQRRARINRTIGTELFQSPKANIDEEKFLFKNIISRADNHFLITYPQFNSNGRNFTESPFLDELRNIAMYPEFERSVGFESLSASTVIPNLQSIASVGDIRMNLQHFHWDESDRKFLADLLDDGQMRDIQQRVMIEEHRRQRIADCWSGDLSLMKHREFCFKRPLSITRLQQYAWCPFLYLCETIWKIDSVEEPEAEIPALSDGLLIHALLENFLKSAAPQNFNEWQVFITSNLSAHIDKVLDKIRDNYRTVFSHIDDLVWDKKLHDLRYGLDLFIQREIDALESGYYPSEFEKRYSYSIPLKVANGEINVPFQVKIDRIDRKSDNRRTLIEYKRSSQSARNPIKGVAEGTHFQIPVYLMAYREHDPAARFAGAYSYIFNEGKIAKGVFTEQLFPRNKPISQDEFDTLLYDTQTKVSELLGGIYSGHYFLDPHDTKDRCQLGQCAYYEMCRIDTRMVERPDETGE